MYLDPNVSVKLDHIASTLGIVNDSCIAIPIGISLGMVTRDVIEVKFVREVEQEVITASPVDCKEKINLRIITEVEQAVFNADSN